ncbi:MAG: hypothetical protein J7K45_04345 [Thaumarchaeota archaeon]|nr:hypothetical protein [Nitrososphaerota archaeon]
MVRYDLKLFEEELKERIGELEGELLELKDFSHLYELDKEYYEAKLKRIEDWLRMLTLLLLKKAGKEERELIREALESVLSDSGI